MPSFQINEFWGSRKYGLVERYQATPQSEMILATAMAVDCSLEVASYAVGGLAGSSAYIRSQSRASMFGGLVFPFRELIDNILNLRSDGCLVWWRMPSQSFGQK